MRRCVTLVLALAFAFPLLAQPSTTPLPPPTPEQLWQALMTGNGTFMAGNIKYEKLDDERKALVNGQNPPVLILACSDSRVPPELVFNQSLGALFIVRSAGNVADEFGLASIEFAVSKGWTKLIVVLAHENCGAMVEALKPDDPPTLSLIALVARLRHSFIAGQTTLADATRANARASAAWLTAESTVIRKAVMEGKVRIVPAYYELGSGKVSAIN